MRYIKQPNAAALTLSKDTRLAIPDCEYAPYVREQFEKLLLRVKGEGKPCHSVTMTLGIPETLRARFSDDANDVQRDLLVQEQNDYVENLDAPAATPYFDPKTLDEEYAISFGEEILVYAATPTGFLRAISTIMMQCDKGEMCEQLILDAPACADRGYRCYLPGRKTMQHFLDVLDFLVYYKYNAIILEIGGAMEYKRRPIINEKWVEFCLDMSEYSGKTTDMQDSQQWPKDSLHIENGDGSFLTQEECRELARECRRRGIEVIPECPTLSHADYICNPYPELAERQNDPCPDTYCPAHPDTYKVVFDILDEVIEVFEPKRLNIGHDEYYSPCICDRCRDKDPARIYADDVTVLHDHLAEKGVVTMMWSEKILKARSNSGNRSGGWYEEKVFNGARYRVPTMFHCVDMLPKDILHLHWYWCFGDHLDDEFHAHNFPMVFGNFSATGCQKFRARMRRGARGGFLSNWGPCAPEYLQRNKQYYFIISTGLALWSDTYDSDQAPLLKKQTIADLYAKYTADIQHPLKVLHASYHTVVPKHHGFWCGRFIEDSVYMLGHYEVTYADGTTALLPVKHGTNIANRHASDGEMLEACYSTMPIADEEGYLFEHTYENPHPELEIKEIRYIPLPDKADIRVEFTFLK